MVLDKQHVKCRRKTLFTLKISGTVEVLCLCFLFVTKEILRINIQGSLFLKIMFPQFYFLSSVYLFLQVCFSSLTELKNAKLI